MLIEVTEKEAMAHFRREFNKSRAPRKYNIAFIVWICMALCSGGAISMLYGVWQATLVTIPFVIPLYFIIKKVDIASALYAQSQIKEIICQLK